MPARRRPSANSLLVPLHNYPAGGFLSFLLDRPPMPLLPAALLFAPARRRKRLILKVDNAQQVCYARGKDEGGGQWLERKDTRWF